MAKKQIVASAFSVTAAPDDGAKGDRGARLRQTDWAEGKQYLSGLMASYGTMLYYTKICYICV